MAAHEPVFVHLRVHTEFSLHDGIVRIDEAMARCRQEGMPALAMTDLANLFGAIKFCQAAQKQGIKPIIGIDAWMTNEDTEGQSSRLLLLCQNQTGYRNLCWLISQAFRANKRMGRAEIRKSWLTSPNTDGLIALSGAHIGEIGLALLAGDSPRAAQLANDWHQRFPGRFYLELQRSGLVEQETYNQAAVRLAVAQDLPVVATHPVQFMDAGDFQAHEARVCIAEGRHLNDRRRPRHFTVQQYFKSQAEMAELFSDLPQALANSVEIAKRCSFCPAFGKLQLPQFPTPASMSLDEYLIERTRQGFRERL